MQMHALPGMDLLRDPFWITPLGAPGARLICAGVRPSDSDTALAGFEAADVAGCDPDPALAAARCVGEAVEYLAQLSPDDDVRLLARAPGTILPDDRSAGPWIAGRMLGSGAEYALPADRIVRRREGAEAGIGIGCAAGRDGDLALAGALCERIEHDAVAQWWYGAANGRVLAPAVDDAAQAYLARLRGDRSERVTWLLDISRRPGLPVVAAFAHDTDGSGFVAGMAGHADIGQAAAKAVRELIQMEVGLDIARFKQRRGHVPNTHEARMLRRADLIDGAALARAADAAPFAHPPAGGSAGEQIAGLVSRLDGPAYAADLTRQRYGLHVAKVLTPGLGTIPDAAEWEAGAPADRVALY